jgi:hypothetical protein
VDCEPWADVANMLNTALCLVHTHTHNCPEDELGSSNFQNWPQSKALYNDTSHDFGNENIYFQSVIIGSLHIAAMYSKYIPEVM